MCQFINNLWHWASDWGPSSTGEYEVQPLVPSNFRYGFSWPCVPAAGPTVSWPFTVSWPLPTKWIWLCYWYHEDERKKGLYEGYFFPPNLVQYFVVAQAADTLLQFERLRQYPSSTYDGVGLSPSTFCLSKHKSEVQLVGEVIKLSL